MSEEETETFGLLDSDAILVAQYCAQVDLDELRRYVAIDLVTALQPLTKESLALARQIEGFLIGKGPKVVGNDA